MGNGLCGTQFGFESLIHGSLTDGCNILNMKYNSDFAGTEKIVRLSLGV